jgi:hypothetical protein
MGLTREAKLKSKFGHVYPEIRPGWWEPASVVARRVADRLLTRHGYAGLLKRRVLLDDHFEFRGGPPQDLRPGGRVSRFCDGVR